MSSPSRIVRAVKRRLGLGRTGETRDETAASSGPFQNAVMPMREARFQIGQVVKHRFFPFRGVIFDVDPEFDNSEEWYQSIPEEVRPRKDQPYYHLFAENERTHYIAYVSEQNLEPDDSETPVSHPDIPQMFEPVDAGQYRLKMEMRN